MRKTPSWPRSWAIVSLLWLYSHRNSGADLHLLGQPNTFLALDGYYTNMRVPFYKSIRMTAQLPKNHTPFHVYTIVRGQVSPEALTPSWPRSWANFSLLPLYPHRKAWANWHLLGQPDTFLAAGERAAGHRWARHKVGCGRSAQGWPKITRHGPAS